MKINELKQIKSQKIADLKKLVKEKKQELVKTYTKIKVGQEKNLKKTRLIRRDIAQILGIITESKERQK